MPGTINHERQYTSNYYTPFRYYSTGNDTATDAFESSPIVDFTASEAAATNEVLLLPVKTATIEDPNRTPLSGTGDKAIYAYTPSTDAAPISVYTWVKIGYKSGSNIVKQSNWVKVQDLNILDGTIASISPLFATYYKFVCTDSDFTINISNNAVNGTGMQPSIIQQTFPVQAWTEIAGTSAPNGTTRPNDYLAEIKR